MAVYTAICPQCVKEFEWVDGYPDLFGVRLCSLSCRDIWLVNHQYRGVPDEPVVQSGEVAIIHQVGDSSRGPIQVSELAPRRRGESQME